MYRIASFTVAQYWRDYYKANNGLDCGHCSNPQRKKSNEANHEISLMDTKDAEDLITFTEMLLKFVYEFPGKVRTENSST